MSQNFGARVTPLEGSVSTAADKIVANSTDRVAEVADVVMIFGNDIFVIGTYHGKARSQLERRREIWRSLRHTLGQDFMANFQIEVD